MKILNCIAVRFARRERDVLDISGANFEKHLRPMAAQRAISALFPGIVKAFAEAARGNL
jgi:hypothetical protein